MTLLLGVILSIIFLDPLVSYLFILGLTRLTHIRACDYDFNDVSYWFTTQDLGLLGEMALEWSHFTASLNHLGIRISRETDSLLWVWNSKHGQIGAKESYKAISTS